MPKLDEDRGWERENARTTIDQETEHAVSGRTEKGGEAKEKMDG